MNEADKWLENDKGRYDKIATMAYVLIRSRLKHPLLKNFAYRVK